MSFTKPEWAWQALEARIAELEAELAEAKFCAGCNGGEWTWQRRAEEAEARLGAVIALLDRDYIVTIAELRAAATGTS